ncbi:unnamed protein product, partial [Durusdinium trenchii]
EIALRMIQVAEAASVAAQSAAASLGRRSEGDKNRFRVLPKPANFDAKTREEELYQASRGTTSYELIHGKAYDGLLALPKEEAFFRYRGTEAEEVEPYALSKERQEESRNEIEEVTQERRAAGETLDALEGEPAPKPHNKRGSGGEMDIPMVIHPSPWDDEEPPPEGRALRKLPPPESAVKAEPEANVQDMEK